MPRHPGKNCTNTEGQDGEAILPLSIGQTGKLPALSDLARQHMMAFVVKLAPLGWSKRACAGLSLTDDWLPATALGTEEVDHRAALLFADHDLQEGDAMPRVDYTLHARR